MLRISEGERREIIPMSDSFPREKAPAHVVDSGKEEAKCRYLLLSWPVRDCQTVVSASVSIEFVSRRRCALQQKYVASADGERLAEAARHKSKQH